MDLLEHSDTMEIPIFRDNTHISSEYKRFIWDNKNKMTRKQIAQETGIPQSTVTKFLLDNGFRTKRNKYKHKWKPYTEDEDKFIIDSYKKGVRPYQISRALGRTSAAIYTRLRTLRDDYNIPTQNKKSKTTANTKNHKIVVHVPRWEDIESIVNVVGEGTFVTENGNYHITKK